MNLKQLKKSVGYRVKLVPQAYHLDTAGDPLPFRDEDWIIMSVTNEYAEVSALSGHFYRLGKDHIFCFVTDHQRAGDGLKHGFLQLKVQIYIQGADVAATPNHMPGQPVPPQVNVPLRARATFIPDVERVFRRQVQILERVRANFSTTAAEMLGKQYEIRPSDTWESLKPIQSPLFPDSALFRELSAADAALLAEFYAAVGEVADLIEHWTGTVPLTEYNAWNVLMHKVQNSLRLGELVVQKFCANRPFDATSPEGGTLLSAAERSLRLADQGRAEFMQQYATAQEALPSHPTPRRRR